MPVLMDNQRKSME